jgi:hypothetical protein
VLFITLDTDLQFDKKVDNVMVVQSSVKIYNLKF